MTDSRWLLGILHQIPYIDTNIQKLQYNHIANKKAAD